jgi:hypothetical protein
MVDTVHRAEKSKDHREFEWKLIRMRISLQKVDALAMNRSSVSTIVLVAASLVTLGVIALAQQDKPLRRP